MSPTTANATDYYKVTAADGSAYHGGAGVWTPGRWRIAETPLIPCKRGLHVVTRDQLVRWLGPQVWHVEVDASREINTSEPDKVVVARARLTTRLEAWNERTQRLFAADCAEHVLALFEEARPADDRPRKAIAAARAFANGLISPEELSAAADAAYTPYAAAASVAYTSYVAARSAAYAAYVAASVAYTAASVAYTVAYAAAYDAAEREWQTERLWQYLNGEVE